MHFGDMLSTLLIGPLKLLFEVIFSMVNRLNNPGLSIVALSLAMNLLVLPLYRRADAIQDEARETEERLSHWVKHIRRTFHGDQRFMILQTYYRQNHYSPMNALRGALPLVLEVPFFIAAYQFLSNLEILQNRPFGPIANLGAPDAMVTLFGLSINVLPILMTVINLISSAIYTKGAPLKSRIQLYVMALIFLVLLYDSPSGLTMYWTLNNLFSLVKNLVVKSEKTKKAMRVLCGIAGAGALVFALLKGPGPRHCSGAGAPAALACALDETARGVQESGFPRKGSASGHVLPRGCSHGSADRSSDPVLGGVLLARRVYES